MARTKNSTSNKKVEKKSIVCANGCNSKPKALSNFYKSTLEEYEGYGGYCTTCKTCLRKSIIDQNLNTVTMESIRGALRKLNKPLIESVFIEVKNNTNTTNNTFLGKYVKQLNCYPKYKDKMFSDTVDIQLEQEKVMNAKVDYEKEQEVTEEMKRFWGRGLENQDYLDLQTMYNDYTESEKGMTKKKTDDYRALCIYEIQKSKIQYDLTKIPDTQKLQSLIDNLSSSLGIQTVQKMDDDRNERFTLGLLARYHEDVAKKPIRRWVEDLGGIDPIDMKIKVYYKGGILNAMGINNPDLEEYKKEVERYTVKIKQIEEDIRKEKELSDGEEKRTD